MESRSHRSDFLGYVICIVVFVSLLTLSVSAAPVSPKGKQTAKPVGKPAAKPAGKPAAKQPQTPVTASKFDGVYIHEVVRPDLESFEERYVVKGGTITGTCGPYAIQGTVDLKPGKSSASFKAKATRIIKNDDRTMREVSDFNGYLTLYPDGNAELVARTFNDHIRRETFVGPIASRVKGGGPEIAGEGPLTIFIEGWRDNPDGEDTHLVKDYYEAWALPNAHYFNWEDREGLLKAIRSAKEDTRINLVGHSFGADTAAQIAAACGRRINLLITIDPVGGTPPADPKNRQTPRDIQLQRAKAARQSVDKWINVNADYVAAGGEDDSDKIVRRLSYKWGDVPDGIADVHLDAPLNHRHFRKMMAYGPDGESAEQVLLVAAKK